MLNYETILSSYDDKLTLMQWLKKVEDALKNASAVAFNVTKTGDATLTFSLDFEDGSKIESGPIVLQQGESVESAAITNGHLFLTLTNGDVLDAGNMFNGDISLTGNLSVSGTLKQGTPNFSVDVAVSSVTPFLTPTNIYNRGIEFNNVLYFIISSKVTENAGVSHTSKPVLGYNAATLPQEIADKIYDINGSKLSDAVSASAIIALLPCKCFNLSTGEVIDAVFELRHSTTPRVMTLNVIATSNITIGANEEIMVSARCFLTLQ